MPTGWLRRHSHRRTVRAFATVAAAAILATLTTGLLTPARASADGETYTIATDTTFAPRSNSRTSKAISSESTWT